MLRAAPFLLALLAATGPAHAGAWTQRQGEGLVIVNLSVSSATERFDEQGRAVPDLQFEKIEARAYIEYGLRDWLTLTAQPEWRQKRRGTVAETSGLGRLDFGARARMWTSGGHVASVQASLRAPGGSDDLPATDGADQLWEVDARALYGYGFRVWERNGFVDLQLGYRHRFGAPADEVRLDATAGFELREGYQLIVQSFNALGLGAGGDFLDDREHNVALSGVWAITERWSVQTGAFTTVAGANALREFGYFGAIWFRF